MGAEREDEAMRLKLVMKDREYRDALAERIRRSRQNLYVIIEDNFRMEEDTLLVTDVGEGKLREGMVLLSSECRREVEGKGPYVLFKYAGVDELLTDLRLCAFLWTGKGDLRRGEERIVTVGAVERTDLGHRLAEQVSLELGERLEEPVLLLDLTYFYREGQPEESGNTFRKLVYPSEREEHSGGGVFSAGEGERVSGSNAAGNERADEDSGAGMSGADSGDGTVFFGGGVQRGGLLLGTEHRGDEEFRVVHLHGGGRYAGVFSEDIAGGAGAGRGDSECGAAGTRDFGGAVSAEHSAGRVRSTE